MYRTVKFKSGYVDEPKFDDAGSPIAPGSRELAEDIVAALGPDVVVSGPVKQHSFYGWGFSNKFGFCKFYNVLNPAGEECYFTVSVNWYWLLSLLMMRPKAIFDRYCEIVDRALRSLPKVSDIVWESYRS
jgi:hypothetical protein